MWPDVGSDSTPSICRVRRHRFCRLFSPDRWRGHVERSCAPHRWRISGYLAAQAAELKNSRTQELKNSSTQERKNAAMRTSARELLVLLEFSSAFIPNSESSSSSSSCSSSVHWDAVTAKRPMSCN